MRLNLFLLELSQSPDFFRHLDVLAAMAGQAAGAARYFSTTEQSFAALDPADPIWFVPVGIVVPGAVVGIDARPELLATGQLQMLERSGRGELVATAFSPAEHLRLYMAQSAMRLRLGGDRALFAEQRKVVEAVVGSPLWPPGSIDSAESLYDWLWSQGDRSPYTASMQTEEDPTATLRILDEAIERAPTSAFLGYEAAANALKLEDFDRHALYTARAVRSPLWTRYNVSFRDIDIDVRYSREDRPDLISEAEVELLTQPEPERWEAAARAEPDRLAAARLAVDATYLSGLDDRLVDQLLRPLFTELGWRSALRLCDFRQDKLQ